MAAATPYILGASAAVGTHTALEARQDRKRAQRQQRKVTAEAKKQQEARQRTLSDQVRARQAVRRRGMNQSLMFNPPGQKTTLG